MIHLKKWVLGGRMALAMAILCICALVGYAQCVSPGTPINFSTAGNNTAAGYTTTYVLTDNSGSIIQTVSPGFAAPNQNSTFKVYAVNYNTASGNTAPTLTAGTNVAAIGGTCASVSSSPITFCVTGACEAPGTPISFSTAGNNTAAGYVTTYVLTDASGVIMMSSSSSPIAAPTSSGNYSIYAVNYNTSSGNTAPTLTAGTSISAIGGSCASVSGSPITFCVTAPCVTPGSAVSFATAGNNTASGYTTVYALTDNSGNIISTATSSPITAPTTTGSYKIYVVNYNTTGTAPTLTAGTNIGAIGGTCTAASAAPLLFDVCAPACNAGTAQVALSGSSLTIACGSTSANLTTLVSSTAPAGTSIVFYTTADHSGAQYTTPTNATAGTYYAFIFDAANNCYNTGASTAQIVVTAATGCVPDLSPIIYALPATQYGPSSNFTVVVDVYDLLPTPSSGLITVYVTKDPLVALSFNPGSVLVGGKLVQNSIWTFDGTSSSSAYILTTTQVIAGKGHQSFGFTGVLTPGNTQGTLSISTTIVGGSGGEIRMDNNSDADKIDYFKK